ncbi:hypothetical protein PybrP1_001370 [[Pythium] brassicae (nom. inval.)]|nr:hypothetical protein PybrP1_001370 [[Pythium] brassicae (nom. inval.)]
MATLALNMPQHNPALAHDHTAAAAAAATAASTLALPVDVSDTKQEPPQQPEAEEEAMTSTPLPPPPPTDLLLESDSQEPMNPRAEESDWRTSSDDATPARFSLIALPGRVRASLFSRKPRKLKRRKPRAGTAGGDTSSQSSGSKARALSQATPKQQTPKQLLPTPASALPTAVATPTRTPTKPTRTPASTPDKSVETFKHFWDEKLRHTMEKLSSRSKAEPGTGGPSGTGGDGDDVFHLLLKLYAHQDIVEELYSSCATNAPEFEFYIPQLGTFLLHGNYAKQHQLECFLLSRSGESLPFAHRLAWFLRSFGADARGYKSEYLSVTASPDEENSDLLSAIAQRAGVPALLMNNGLCDEEVSVATPSNLLRRRSSVFAMDSEMDPRVRATDASFAVHLQSKQQLVMYKARPQEGSSHQASLYAQTPAFVGALTGLADELIAVPLAQRRDVLRAGLGDIQARVLPSDVLYLPVGNTHHRVKAIHVDECFTFSTKERVPYFLVVEVLEYSVQPKPATASPTALKRKQKAASVKKAAVVAAAASGASAADAATASCAPVATATQRPSSRGFSLMLPFKKSGHSVEPATSAVPRAGGHTSDSSVSEATVSRLSRLSERMTDCTDSSSALSVLEAVEPPSDEPAAEEPSAADTEPVGAPPAEATPAVAKTPEKEKGTASTPAVSSFFGYLLGSSKKKAGLKSQQKTGAVAVTTAEPLDGEDGDDEKEADETGEDDKAHRIDASSTPAPTPAAVAVAPVVAPAVVSAVAGEQEADKEALDEAEKQASEEQKMRMGQWSLPRAERRKSRSNSSASARSGGQFDTFYSSWFSKKQKHEKDAVCTHPETTLNDAASDQPVGAADSVTREDAPAPTRASLSEAVVPTSEPAAAAPAPAPVVRPAKAKAAAKKAGKDTDTSQDERGGRRKRDRDLSLSLDFMDSNAWKVKFDLEDELSDNEREGSDSDPEEKDASAAPETTGDAQAGEKEEEEEEEEEEAPIIVFRERWSEKEARLRKTSQFSDHPGWRLLSVIVKSNDDLRQEQFAAQLIAQCDRIFKEYALPLRLRPYNVIATSATTGLIEAVPDTVSLDSLKRNDPDYTTLLDFYYRLHGDADSTFRYFRSLCIRAFLALQRSMDKIVLLVEMMLVGNADLPCFAGGKRAVVEGLRARLRPGERSSACQLFVNQLVDQSINNWRTRWYDKYQRACLGIR